MSIRKIFGISDSSLTFDDIVANAREFFGGNSTCFESKRYIQTTPSILNHPIPIPKKRRSSRIVARVHRDRELTCGPFVFISHASCDNILARSLVTVLEKNGIECWIAPRNIPVGNRFDVEIVQALRMCDDFLLLFSEEADQSAHVKREVCIWMEDHDSILPVQLNGAQPSERFVYYLKGIQFATTADPEHLSTILKFRHLSRY